MRKYANFVNIDRKVGLHGSRPLEIDILEAGLLLKRGCDIIRGNNHKPGDRSNPPEERERERKRDMSDGKTESKTLSSIAVNEIRDRTEIRDLVVTTSCAQYILDRAVSWYFHEQTDRVES